MKRRKKEPETWWGNWIRRKKKQRSVFLGNEGFKVLLGLKKRLFGIYKRVKKKCGINYWFKKKKAFLKIPIFLLLFCFQEIPLRNVNECLPWYPPPLFHTYFYFFFFSNTPKYFLQILLARNKYNGNWPRCRV